jgi:hypothetical protein
MKKYQMPAKLAQNFRVGVQVHIHLLGEENQDISRMKKYLSEA